MGRTRLGVRLAAERMGTFPEGIGWWSWPRTANCCPPFGPNKPDPAGGWSSGVMQVLEIAGGMVAELAFPVGPRSAVPGDRRPSSTIVMGHHRVITTLTERVTANHRETFPGKKATGWR